MAESKVGRGTGHGVRRSSQSRRGRGGGRLGKRRQAYEDRRVQWERLARTMGGTFERGDKPLDDALYVRHKGWTLRADVYVQSNGQTAVHYTRVRAPYLANDAFWLRMYRSSWFNRMAEKLGLGGFSLGDPHIDRKYVVKGHGDGRLRSFFLDGRLRAVLKAQESFRLEVRELPRKERRKWGGRVRQVHIRTTGQFIGATRVKGLIELCAATLDRLSSAGSASTEPLDPDRHYGDPRWS